MNELTQRALSYLERDPLHTMDMLEPLRRGQARVEGLREDGALVYDGPSKTYFLAAESREAGDALCAGVEAPYLFVAHDRENAEFFRDKFGFRVAQECWPAAYLSKTPLPVPGDLDIRRLGQEHFSVVYDNYSTFSDADYVKARIREGVMHGAFQNGRLMGFIGMHAEGSVGMLEVLPQYRRRGVAAALMAYQANWCLEQGYVPFSQIFLGNEASLRLHQKVGYSISEKPLFWVMD